MFDKIKAMGQVAALLKDKERLRESAQRIKLRAAEVRAEGESGGGAVRATVDGSMQVLKVDMQPALVAGMSEKLRTTFVLFEIEGYSGEEIASIQDVPLGTVWTRLHLARKEFWKLLKKQRQNEERSR